MAISPVFSNHFNFYVLDFSILLIVLLSALIIIILLGYRSFQRLKKSFKKVSWEIKLLDALLKDVEAVSESGRKLDEKAHQLGNSQLRSVATVRLNDATRGWVDETKTVVRNVQDWRKTYEELGERKKFLKWIYFFLLDYKIIRRPQIDMDSCSSEINVQIVKIHREQICKFVESSRSTVRSLQDRPIAEDERKPYQKHAKSASIEKKLKVLISKTPDLVSEKQKKVAYSINFPLQLLIAFLQDLEGLILESKIEEAWVEEAHDTIDEIQHEIERKQKIPTIMSWLPYFGNLITRRKLMKSFSGMESRLLRLFLRKQEFGFTFVKRYQSHPVLLSPQKQTHATTLEKDIVVLLDDFSNQLKHAPPVATYQLKQLEKLFHQVHQFLKEANAVEGIENLKNSKAAWKDQMKAIIKDANTSLDAYIRNSTSKRSNTQSETDPWQNFSAELGEFQKALELLEERIKLCRIELKEETNLEVGLEEDIHEIVTQLTAKRDRFSTHAIVGMKGIGKTTLAKMVLNNKNIQNHFHNRYLVSLPDSVDDDKNLLLKRLGHDVLPPPEDGTVKDYSFKEVKDFLKGRKYLLVLDNIMRKETWDTLKEAFLDNKNGSRILLTTRDKSVASHADPSCFPYRLRLRTKDESWDLFRQMVPQPQRSQELKRLAEKFVRRCGGLPLSILSTGYLLSGKEVTTGELSRALEHINPYQTPWIDNWETNGKDLSPNLKKCLSHFAQFPKDSEISAKRLVALWVAEGFVDQTDKPLEYVAKQNLNHLIECNLVQELERKHNGKVLSCGLPSALQELWSRLESPDSSLSPDQRLPYYFVQMDTISSQRHGSRLNSRIILQKCRNLSSILFFDSREGDKPGKEIGDFLRMGIASGHLLHLEVLDLEHIFRPHLPRSIGRLTRLKYLGLRWTYLEEIPSSIGKLVNLQTLDLKHTYIRTLPGSIWKLQNLQNLYMNGIYRSTFAPQQRGNFLDHLRGNLLQNLEVLWGAFMDSDSPLKDALKLLKNLRKLELAFQLDLSQQNELAKSLVELNHIQTLRLKSIDEMGRPQDIDLNHLSGLVNLSDLYLFGKLLKQSIIVNIIGLPQSLTELTLSASQLSNDPMPDLEKFYNLKSLSFFSGSYIGKRMVCSNGGFRQLQFLKFFLLQELEEWTVEEQAMPNLKRLEIRSCKRLKVHFGLGNLKSVREFKIEDMPEEFKTSIEKKTKELNWGEGDIAIFTDNIY